MRSNSTIQVPYQYTNHPSYRVSLVVQGSEKGAFLKVSSVRTGQTNYQLIVDFSNGKRVTCSRLDKFESLSGNILVAEELKEGNIVFLESNR